MWKYLFIITVIYFKPSTYSSSLVYQTVDSSFTDSWEVSFTIFPKVFKGIIFYCIDSKKNQFILEVTKASNNNRNIRMSFNKACKFMSLEQLCGCDQCTNKMMKFDIKFLKEMIIMNCNSQIKQNISIMEPECIQQDGNIDIHIYPPPLSITNKRKKMYIAIGNIGSYVGEGNVSVLFLKEQIVGCLDSFSYNGTQLKLIEKGTKIRRTCPMICRNNTCNGGECKDNVSSYNISCNCSSTSLNGPYCNRTMKMYKKGKNNSFVKATVASKLYLKITWKQLLYKLYCLMEVVTGNQHFIIMIKESNLIVNSTGILDIDKDGINYINVYIIKDNLTIKKHNNEYKLNFHFGEITKINVGFSEKNKNCETFEGLLDIDFDMSEQTVQTHPIQTYGPVMTTKNFNFTPEPLKYANIHLIIILIILIIFVSLSCGVLMKVVCALNGELIPKNTNSNAERILPTEIQEVVNITENTDQQSFKYFDYEVVDFD